QWRKCLNSGRTKVLPRAGAGTHASNVVPEEGVAEESYGDDAGVSGSACGSPACHSRRARSRNWRPCWWHVTMMLASTSCVNDPSKVLLQPPILRLITAG